MGVDNWLSRSLGQLGRRWQEPGSGQGGELGVGCRGGEGRMGLWLGGAELRWPGGQSRDRAPPCPVLAAGWRPA